MDDDSLQKVVEGLGPKDCVRCLGTGQLWDPMARKYGPCGDCRDRNEIAARLTALRERLLEMAEDLERDRTQGFDLPTIEAELGHAHAKIDTIEKALTSIAGGQPE
jgi:hypothetical protein